ncbi:MAG: hypothetical protein HGA87_06295 [Desulfobulbaceae bacterium]|nr:hypothetical protein [Desulfobulbaceae bacterium]
MNHRMDDLCPGNNRYTVCLSIGTTPVDWVRRPAVFGLFLATLRASMAYLSALTIIALLSLLMVSVASAETIRSSPDIPPSPKFQAYIESILTSDIIRQIGLQQDKKFGLHQNVKSEPVVQPIGLSIVNPIDFPDGSNNPISGAWTVRFAFTRNGDTKVYNIIFFAEAGGAPHAEAFWPGTTLAAPLLIHDALLFAVNAAKIKRGDLKCKSMDIFDMRVDKPLDEKGCWSEIWTFRACGKDVDVPISFVPNPKTGGTSFFIRDITMPNR